MSSLSIIRCVWPIMCGKLAGYVVNMYMNWSKKSKFHKGQKIVRTPKLVKNVEVAFSRKKEQSSSAYIKTTCDKCRQTRRQDLHEHWLSSLWCGGELLANSRRQQTDGNSSLRIIFLTANFCMARFWRRCACIKTAITLWPGFCIKTAIP